MRLLSQGAEAEIYIDKDLVFKKRLVKKYRNPLLDKKLRLSRMRREVKVLKKLHEQGLKVPEVYDVCEKETSFSMQRIRGKTLKESFSKKGLFMAFEQIIALHKEEIIHGDLTTLNMIASGTEVYLIDFGLAQFSRKVEERAVDLLVFFNCLRNEHEIFFKYKKELLEFYEKETEFGSLVRKRLEILEERGRNK